MPKPYSIDKFIKGPLKRGVALSDIFEFGIILDNQSLSAKLNELLILCKDVNFPSSVMSLSNNHGVNLGENEKRYPYAKTTNELEATFIVDGDLRIVYFFEAWAEIIYETTKLLSGSSLRRFNYPENYYATARIKKFERGNTLDSPKDYTAIMELTELYPYAQDIIPLGYDKTRPMDLTMRFTYTRRRYVF